MNFTTLKVQSNALNAASGRHLIPETRCQDAGFFI